MIFEGALSVKAIINGNKRKVEKVIIDSNKHSKDISYLKKICLEKNIDIEFKDRNSIDALAQGKTHGGVIGIAGKRINQSLDDLLSEQSFICLLDGIEDPFNYGYILRSLYSAGCSGVLCNNRDWSLAQNVICKSSAGASELINIHQSDDLVKDLLYFKSKGIECLAAYRNNAVSYLDKDYRKPILIAIGGQMRGISKDLLKEMDGFIYIPYANDFRNALNASSATSVIAYEILRQRNQL